MEAPDSLVKEFCPYMVGPFFIVVEIFVQNIWKEQEFHDDEKYE